MPRHPFVGLIACLLAVYGLYIVRYVPPLAVTGSVPSMLACFALQAVVAFVAAVGVWRGTSWAAAATVALGVIIAVTEAVEALVLGIVALDRAVLVAIAAIVVTMAVAVYINRTRTLTSVVRR